MEYGLIPNINQYADNSNILIQQIQPSKEISKVSSNTAKELGKENVLDDLSNNYTINASKEVTTQDIAEYQEVVLTNLNFGFNIKSQDFYVKAVRGESETQYPTDEMMKLKAYFIAQGQAQRMAELEN